MEVLKEIGHEVVTDRTQLDNFADIPNSLINYIEKTKNTVLLENACDKGNFTRDPYIAKVKEKSVLAIPLVRQSILDVVSGDQKIREMIIMFADVRNFTSMSESIPAKETFSILNEYLDYVTSAIHDNGGIIDKFLGDGIMALFPNDADKALRAAVQMQLEVRKFNEVRKMKKEPAIHIGVGLHIGTVILGTVGTENRLNTTVIGDPVNLASRLEAHTKINKTSILTSGELEARLKNPESFNLREVGHLIAKGKTNKIKLLEEYSVKPDEIIEKMNAHSPTFNAAVKYFERGQFTEAAGLLEEYMKLVPADEVANYYMNQCHTLVNV